LKRAARTLIGVAEKILDGGQELVGIYRMGETSKPNDACR
jgi:hypothetical protein